MAGQPFTVAAAPPPEPMGPSAPGSAPQVKVFAYTNDQGEVSFQDPRTGGYVWVPSYRVGQAEAQGLVPESREDFFVRQYARRLDAPIEAGLVGAMRAGSLGLLDAISPDLVQQHSRELAEANPTATAIGQVVGTVGSALIPGGPIARAGAAGERLGAAVATGAGGADAVISQLATKALQVGGRGLGEGAVIGAAAATSEGLMRDNLDVVEIAKAAVTGAALQGALSIAGAGITALSAKGITKARSAVYQAAGVDEMRLQMLLAREKELIQQGRIVTLQRGEQAALPLSGAVEGALQTVQREIADARTKIFASAGQLLKSTAAPLGLLTGLHFDSLALGLVTAGAGKVLASGAGQKALGALWDIGGAALGAAGKVLPFMGKVGQVASTELLSTDHITTLAREVAQADPDQVGKTALEGYARAGLDSKTATDAANFQGRRLALLREVLQQPDRVTISRVVNAVEDPRRIMRRLAKLEHTDEDLMVLQRLFPRVAAELQVVAAGLLAHGEKLNPRAASKLEQIADPAGWSQTLAAMFAPPPPTDTEMGKGQRRFNVPDASTTLQRLQGGK